MLTVVMSAALAIPGAAAPIPTDVPPMFYSEIVSTAHQIVVGTAKQIVMRHENGKETIRTYVTFDQLTVFKGTLGPQLTLRLEGGSVGDDHLQVPEMPRFEIGKRYLLYVDGLRGNKVSPIVGFYQGAFQVAQRGGREVLLNTKGLEVIGVQNDRFVFASKPPVKPQVEAPEAVPDPGFEPKPADPDADAKEKAMQQEYERQARASRKPLDYVPRDPGQVVVGGDDPTLSRPVAPARRNRMDAVPLYVPHDVDQGTRASVTSMIRQARIERR